MRGLVSSCHPVISFKALTQLLNLSLLFMAELMEEKDAPITWNIEKKTIL